MTSNLAKTPLIAVFYAALLHFSHLFIPRSPGYREALDQFQMPLGGYLFLILFALYVAVILALGLGWMKKKGLAALAPLSLSLIGCVWLLPSLKLLYTGEPTDTLTGQDILFDLVGGVVCYALVSLLCLLLFSVEKEKELVRQPAKESYKVKTPALAIKLLVLPFVFCILYFLIWYFLCGRLEVVQEFYGLDPGGEGFMAMLIHILLEEFWQVPLTLLKGLAYALLLLPVLFQLAHRRSGFVFLALLFFLGNTMAMLVPSPVVPAAVRSAQLLYTLVLMLVYGLTAALLLHTSFEKVAQPVREPQPVPGRAPQGRGQPPVRRPATGTGQRPEQTLRR